MSLEQFQNRTTDLIETGTSGWPKCFSSKLCTSEKLVPTQLGDYKEEIFLLLGVHPSYLFKKGQILFILTRLALVSEVGITRGFVYSYGLHFQILLVFI